MFGFWCLVRKSEKKKKKKRENIEALYERLKIGQIVIHEVHEIGETSRSIHINFDQWLSFNDKFSWDI